MNKQLYYFVIAITFSANTLVAQSHLTSPRALEAFVNRSGQYLMQIEDNTVAGSPYLEEEFVAGDLHLAGVWYRDIDMRYDIYNRVFELKLGDKIYGIRPDQVGADTIIYHNETFVQKNLGTGSTIRPYYLALLISGEDQALCKQYRIRLDNAVPSDGYNEAKPAEFKANTPAYYYFSNDTFREVDGNRSLVEIFEIDSKELKGFLKKNKLKLSREDDLVHVIRYLSSNYGIKKDDQ